MRRTLVEVLIFALLGALLIGAWWYQENQRTTALAEQADSYETQLADVRQKADFWADTLAASEAVAAFHAFAAGVSPAVQGGRADNVDLALGALLELPGIDFAHALSPDGAVLATSDRKLAASGRVDEQGEWALAATEIITRSGDTRGVTEVAGPIHGADGPLAVLWVGYRTEKIKEDARPESL